MDIGIIGIGIYIPKVRVSVEDIIKSKQLNESKFYANKEVSVAGFEETPTFMASHAAIKALNDAKLNAEEIDLLIYCGDFKDYLKWQASTKVQSDIKAINANCMDLYQSCNSQILGMSLAKSEILTGNVNNVLIVAAEKYSGCTTHHTIGKSIIVGDGAAAVVVSKSEKNILRSFVFKSKGVYNDMMYIKAGSTFGLDSGNNEDDDEMYLYKTRKLLSTNELQQFVQDADLVAKELFQKTLEENNMRKEDIDYVLMLNGNYRHNKNFLSSLGLAHVNNSQKFISETGHLGAADVGYNLFRAFETGDVTTGNHVLIYSGGAGYSWAMTLLTI